MTSARLHALLAVQLVIGASCCSNREPSMSPPPPTPTAGPLGAFTPLRGGFSQAIAPGDRLVTLLMGGATWWEGDEPVTAKLPPHVPVHGTRWTADGKGLRVGLGTLDLAARAWTSEPGLEVWARPGHGGQSVVRHVAWFADAAHVAIVVERRAPDASRTQELVIAAAADGKVRGRRAVEGVTAMAAAADRVLVAAGGKALLVDLDGAVVAEPAPLPDSVVRVREGGGMFAVLGAAGDLALVGANGAALAFWDVHAHDAVPFAGGVLAVDEQGTVRVGCLDGARIVPSAEVASGTAAPIIQLVGGRVVLAGADADPVRVATFTNPCAARP